MEMQRIRTAIKGAQEALRDYAIPAISVAGLALAGCGDNPTLKPGVEGTVVGREYDDPDTWVSATRIGRMTVYQTNRDKEHYYLTVRQCQHSQLRTDDNPNGCGNFEIEVTKEVYGAYPDGSTILINESGEALA